MIKLVTALAATMIAAWVMAGTATSANARECHRCGPLPTTVHIHMLHPTKYVTHYRDTSVYQHVPRYHRIVTVTRIQPIIHIHDVTRVHHRTIYFVKDTYARETVHLQPLTYTRSSTVNYFEGGCGCAP